MSIKKISTPPVPSVTEGQRPRRATAGSGEFDTRLEQFLNQAENRAPELSRAALEARLLSLTMTRGLLNEDPGGVEDYFPSPNIAVGSRMPDFAAFRQSVSGHPFDNPIRAFDAQGPEPAPALSISASDTPSLDKIIERAAGSHGVDQRLIRAVIRTESNFDPEALSPVGAQGLMQLMPETALELGVTNPFDPEQNVMAGTRYLRRLLDRYDGDLDRALAAYNWGMGNVERKGMEHMPRETRNYLARVKAAGSLG